MPTRLSWMNRPGRILCSLNIVVIRLELESGGQRAGIDGVLDLCAEQDRQPGVDGEGHHADHNDQKQEHQDHCRSGAIRSVGRLRV